MKNLSRREYKVLTGILKMRELPLHKMLKEALIRYYGKENVFSTVDYVYAVGDIPIGLVAHIDTVHQLPPKEIFHDSEKGVLWSPQGIGGDDRLGIFAILSLIQEGYIPSVIFCEQEESGGIGAEMFIKDYPEPKKPLSFLLELDRRGECDMVFYDCDNPDFGEYIGTFGFMEDWGSFSDISVIAPDWGIAAANLSIGYDDEHTKVERIYYRHTFNTIEKVRRILEAESVEAHPFNYIPAAPIVFGKYGGKYYDYSYYYSGDYAHSFSGKVPCDSCERLVPSSEIKYVLENGTYWMLCKECTHELTRVCKTCGNRFMPYDYSKPEELCGHCRKKIRNKGEGKK